MANIILFTVFCKNADNELAWGAHMAFKEDVIEELPALSKICEIARKKNDEHPIIFALNRPWKVFIDTTDVYPKHEDTRYCCDEEYICDGDVFNDFYTLYHNRPAAWNGRIVGCVVMHLNI